MKKTEKSNQEDRIIGFHEAILEATDSYMQRDPSVVLYGLGVDDPKGILGTTLGLVEKYGDERVFDTPLAEDAMTGVGIGMALAGLRPIHVHIRMDFLMLAMNQLVNVASKTHYMYGGQECVPMVVRSMIGKSWGQGAQHSQALHSFFAHIPGLKVVMPTTPYDAKGCLIAAIADDNPVIYIDHRLLHYQKGPVPKTDFLCEPGKGRRVVEGKDITIVGISYMQLECYRAHFYLQDVDIQAEIIDPIWLEPMDMDLIIKSVEKTGKLLIVDNAWLNSGISAEIATKVIERLQQKIHVEIHRMGFAPVTCPPAPTLEDAFYPNARTIASKVFSIINKDKSTWMPEERGDLKTTEFKGPF